MKEKNYTTADHYDQESFLSVSSLKNLLSSEPSFRLKQIIKALLRDDFTSYDNISNIPSALRNQLSQSFPKAPLTLVNSSVTKNRNSVKALLRCQDDELIESVLIENARKEYTMCVSTQIGCAAGCVFCATATMGLTRSLSSLEIAFQLPLWQKFLREKGISKKITNIVLMGMGEPLLNYENVREALQFWITINSFGKNHITLSTVGIKNSLNKILGDKEWPGIRLALSLHAPDKDKRSKLIPSQSEDFFSFLTDWAKKYNKLIAGRNNYLTIEYMLINNINDSADDARKLSVYLKKIPRVRVNLINYNNTSHSDFQQSNKKKVLAFQQILKNKDIMTTIRKSLGSEINAACGQLKVDKG